jgi:hypothetical protein
VSRNIPLGRCDSVLQRWPNSRSRPLFWSVNIYLPPRYDQWFFCTMEFLDDRATYNISLVSKKTFYTVLKHVHHTIYRRRFESLYIVWGCIHLRKKPVALETSCTPVLYVFLRRCKKPFYLLVMCYNRSSMTAFLLLILSRCRNVRPMNI